MSFASSAPALTGLRRPGLAALALAATVLACGGNSGSPDGTRMIILGFDGMDPNLTQEMVDAGRLPNVARLIEMGKFQNLETSVPPQSPVAWSNFVTGRDSGGHGIFDFIHRDPQAYFPVPAGSELIGPEEVATFQVGDYCLPKNPFNMPETVSTRQGTPFWQVLEDRGVETSILRMPANYPPSGTASRELTGMGTQDLNGTDGTFAFYTSELFAFAGEDITGGEVFELDVYDGVVESKIYGDTNPFACDGKTRMQQEFKVYIDRESQTAKVELGDQEVVLGVGEWSDWLEVEFELIPVIQTQMGIVRMYLRALEPEFELYVTPIDYDPMDPAAPVASPPEFGAELAEANGRFYTEGMPEDTKAYTDGVFTLDDFLAQIELAGEDQYEQYPWVLDDFMQRPGGLLFYYVGNVDQTGHVMWRTRDKEHPHYDVELDGPHEDLIPSLYEKLDHMVGLTLEAIEEEPDTTVVVMSDHGFASWRNTLHLNAWLAQEGYLTLKNPNSDGGYLTNVDWSKTKAYGVGLSGLYLNVAGRERDGIVPFAQREELMREIGDKLLAFRSEDGEQAVTEVWYAEDYQDRGALEIGPDIQVGYARGWHADNDSALGTVVGDLISTNDGRWTGDHIMDHREVPGVLISNRELQRPVQSLRDLAGTLLLEFGVEGFPFDDNGDT